MSKRDLVVALATFCLTATLFMMIPIRSETPVGTYDPWVDVNEDGSINLLDAIVQGNHFMTSGDSTKNVTIAGRANKLAYSVSTTVDPTYFYTPWIPVDGYSKVTVCIFTSALSNGVAVDARHTNSSSLFRIDFQKDIVYNYVKTYDVPNQEMQIIFANSDTSSRTLFIDVYLIP